MKMEEMRTDIACEARVKSGKHTNLLDISEFIILILSQKKPSVENRSHDLRQLSPVFSSTTLISQFHFRYFWMDCEVFFFISPLPKIRRAFLPTPGAADTKSPWFWKKSRGKANPFPPAKIVLLCLVLIEAPPRERSKRWWGDSFSDFENRCIF